MIFVISDPGLAKKENFRGGGAPPQAKSWMFRKLDFQKYSSPQAKSWIFRKLDFQFSASFLRTELS